MNKKVGEMFSEIFEKWLYQLDEYLQQLLSLTVSSQQVVSEQEVQHLVSKVTQHYKEYYTLKWASAHDDVLAFFCPTWISPLEKAYLWITGWKPSMMFKLLESMRTTGFPGPRLTELTQEQLTEIEQLKMKVRSEEEKVEREMERQQVALADRKMVELARLTSQVRNGGDSVGERVEGLVEVALSGLMAGLEKVMKAADCVRLRILKGVLDVLSPLQSLDFLAAFSMLQLQLRHLGKRSYSNVQLLEV